MPIAVMVTAPEMAQLNDMADQIGRSRSAIAMDLVRFALANGGAEALGAGA
jgi:hypothetical protein